MSFRVELTSHGMVSVVCCCRPHVVSSPTAVIDIFEHIRQQWICCPAGSSSRLVIPVHETASGNLEAEGVLGAVLQPGRRHATPAYLTGLQANVTPNMPAHLRLYQVRPLLHM